MSNFSSLVAHSSSKCLNEEWNEYVKMPQVHNNETPSEWMNRIWLCLQYFRENDLLPTQSKKYLEPRKNICNVSGFNTSYAPEIGIAICFSCNQLVYTGQQTKNIGNYNHIGMERHWASHCSGNSFCGVSYNEYLKIEKKFEQSFDDERVKRAREVGRKIQACITIQRKFIEFMYKPDGMTAKQLAIHFKLLWEIREEMRRVNNRRLKNYNTNDLVVFLQNADLKLDDDDLNIIRDKKVTGRVFFKLNENKLEEWGLPGGSALAITDLINEFKSKEKKPLNKRMKVENVENVEDLKMNILNALTSYFDNTYVDDWSHIGCLEYLAKACSHLTSEDRIEILDGYKAKLRSISLSQSMLQKSRKKAFKLVETADRSFKRNEITLFFEKLDTQVDTNATDDLANAKGNLLESKLKLS
ncbi:hypothetical protein Glove_253g30 [Diversispora epigaea]|uniref:Uncharacterized protein n=1 Tax=Diversispora epigaea TaxID=1348612 RepID=A0A397I9M8_9GLOM|nr:hypothetical protein Glove_253g30 [Diversispora epigaea]